jgi:site-specific DNA-methyltransferase (adenine-specific)
MPEQSVNCCVTSPPYFGLRDYGHDGQIGLEQTPDEFVAKLVEVFREVKRVLRDDGTLWINLGDTYAAQGGAQVQGTKQAKGSQAGAWNGETRKPPQGIKPKDLIGIPWRVAFALQADGWYLRQDIIWHKPNPMPESVRDRCTKAHEYIFLLSKSERYCFNSEAMKEPAICDRIRGPALHRDAISTNGNGGLSRREPQETRNRRSVWTVATRPYKGAHFATYPPELIRPCIRAGCPADGTVLDPFGGSGTTAMVAQQEGRKAILCELNPQYLPLIQRRLADAASTTPGNLG